MLCHEYFEGCCVVIRCEVLPTQLPGEAPLYAKLRQGQRCQTGHGMHMRLSRVLYETTMELPWQHYWQLRYCFSCFKICNRRDNLIVPRAELKEILSTDSAVLALSHWQSFTRMNLFLVAGSNHIWEQPAFAESTEFSAERLSSRSKTTLVPWTTSPEIKRSHGGQQKEENPQVELWFRFYFLYLLTLLQLTREM